MAQKAADTSRTKSQPVFTELFEEFSGLEEKDFPPVTYERKPNHRVVAKQAHINVRRAYAFFMLCHAAYAKLVEQHEQMHKAMEGGGISREHEEVHALMNPARSRHDIARAILDMEMVRHYPMLTGEHVFFTDKGAIGHAVMPDWPSGLLEMLAARGAMVIEIGRSALK